MAIKEEVVFACPNCAAAMVVRVGLLACPCGQALPVILALGTCRYCRRGAERFVRPGARGFACPHCGLCDPSHVWPSQADPASPFVLAA